MRALYLMTVTWGASIVWLAPHPPMLDLPQHAGQLALLKQLLTGGSPWAPLLQVNFFTPYMLGFGLALPLSFVLPVAAAMKLLLSLAYLAFVFMCVTLRRHFGADARLDWLFLTSFFGFAFKWGFFTFLMAVPVGLAFMLLVDRYALESTLRRGLATIGVGLVLLASHGLVFLFSCLVAAGLLMVRKRGIAVWLRALWPLAVLGVACLAYFFAMNRTQPSFGIAPTVPAVMWQLGLRHEVFYYAFGKQWSPLFTIVGVVMLTAPWLMGLRIDLGQPTRLVPFLMVGAGLSFVPSFMFETSFVYQRFAMLLFPSYAWMFTQATKASNPHPRLKGVAMALLMTGCWAVLAQNSIRTWQFGNESADFDRVVAPLERGQRALALIFDRASEADADSTIYLHYAAWYQAEQQGLVDFNFAWVPPQVVRYRLAARPPVMMSFSWRARDFDWNKHQGGTYRYFFVRHRDAVPANLFRGAPCPPALVQHSGTWSVYERVACGASVPLN